MKQSTSILLTSLLGVSLYANAMSTDVPGRIEKISDGDTVWVGPIEPRAVTPQERLTIRMMEIDAPETHLPTPNHGVVGQDHWGDKATEVLADMIPKGTRIHLKDYGLDKYKRTLGTITRGKEEINLEMVRTGWAVTYIICEGKQCYPSFFKEHRVHDYVKACNEAQKNGRGIWDPKDPLEEMPFEFRIRMQEREFDKFVGNYHTRELFGPEDYQEVPECDRVFFMKESEAKRVGFTKGSKNRYALPLLQSINF